MGTEEDSFWGRVAPENPPFYGEFMMKDNTTGIDSCDGVPLLVNYDAEKRSELRVRNTSAPVKETSRITIP